jgi:hydrogenase nickel incorporation protein HypB
MKKIVYILVITAITFSISSCGNKKKKESHTEGTHVHQDGTVHSNNAHEHNAKPDQEAFEVKADSNTEQHKHEGGDVDKNGHKHEPDDAHGEGTNHDNDEHGDESGQDHDHEHGEHK